MFPRAPAKAPAAAPPAAAAVVNWAPKNGEPGPEVVVVQFCAKAAEPVEIATAKAKPATIRPLRAFNLMFMKKPQNCNRRWIDRGKQGEQGSWPSISRRRAGRASSSR